MQKNKTKFIEDMNDFKIFSNEMERYQFIEVMYACWWLKLVGLL